MTEAQTRERKLAAAHAASQVRSITGYRKQTWAWQKLMRKPRTPTGNGNLWRATSCTASGCSSCGASASRRPPEGAQPAPPPSLEIIQRHEGPWNDPHAPYYGGLQMDITFQRLYGAELLRRKGTADNWTPLEQIWVAERRTAPAAASTPGRTRRAPAASSDELWPGLRVDRLRMDAAGGVDQHERRGEHPQ